MTFFSIISVTFNNKDGLKKTLLSLDRQRFRDFEIIIIDGNSTDGTKEFIHKVITSQIKFISEKDKGIYDAQNKGIGEAVGKYLLFLNAGDTFENDYVLQKINDAADKMPDILYGDIITVDDKKNRKYLIYPDTISYNYWYTKEYLCHQAVFFSRGLFRKFGLYDLNYRFAADFDLLQRLWFHPVITKKHVETIVVVYNLEGASAKIENRAIIINEYKAIRKKYHPLFINLFYSFIYGNKFARVVQLILKKIFRLAIKPFHIVFSMTKRLLIRTDKKIYKSLTIDRNKKPFILHFSTTDQGGGAAKAAFNIHKGIIEKGQNSIMLVAKQNSKVASVVLAKDRTGFMWLLDVIRNLRRNRNYKKAPAKTGVLYSYQNYSFLDLQLILDILKPDIVHLHWIGYNYISIEDIGRIKVPIVWTLHDMWPFSGAEHVCFDDSYKKGYSKEDEINLSVWNRKSKSYEGLNIFPVGVSRWMAKIAKESLLFSKYEVSAIPNILETETFFPRDSLKAREYWRINSSDTVLLFGSDYKDVNKGYFVIEGLVKKYEEENREDLTFVIFGGTPIDINTEFVKLIHLGHLHSKEDLAFLYSAADVTLIPSRIESFCLTAAESISCGTPVVCFDTSGLQDIVMNGENGYRSICFDENDFKLNTEKIILEQKNSKYNREKLHQYCLDNFSSDKVASSYIKLYESLYDATLDK